MGNETENNHEITNEHIIKMQCELGKDINHNHLETLYELNNLYKQLSLGIEATNKINEERFKATQERFDRNDERFQRIENRIDNMNERIDKIADNNRHLLIAMGIGFVTVIVTMLGSMAAFIK